MVNASVRTTTKTSISLSWDKPELTNGKIISYTVQWASFGDSYESTELIGADVFDYTIGNLTLYTNYSVEVFARTSAGRGENDQLVVVTDTGC